MLTLTLSRPWRATVDHVQRHPDVPHQDIRRRLGVLVLEEDRHALAPSRAAGPRRAPSRKRAHDSLVRRLERVVVAFDSGPDDEVRAEFGGEVDRLACPPERLGPRRFVRGDEAALLEARVEVEAAARRSRCRDRRAPRVRRRGSPVRAPAGNGTRSRRSGPRGRRRLFAPSATVVVARDCGL